MERIPNRGSDDPPGSLVYMQQHRGCGESKKGHSNNRSPPDAG